MCRSHAGVNWLFRSMGALALVAVVVFAGAGTVKADPDSPDANTCNGSSELSYTGAPNFAQIGDIVHVVISLGAGGIQGGTTLHINRVRFNLDCTNTTLGLNCDDDGAVISYQDNLVDSCPGVTFVTTHSAGDLVPNQVVFDYASGSLDIPANTPGYCTIEFDVRVDGVSTDGTPDAIEQASGFDAASGDGVCNTVPQLSAGNTNTGSIRSCPICDDGNQCNGTETCDSNADPSGSPCVPGGDTITCNDQDPCTSDVCSPDIPAPADPCVYTPGALDCNDNDPCTSDACVTGTGCVNTPGALDCNDDDPCTSDACVTGTGCVNTPGALDCNDDDVCTSDDCVAGTGCVNTPGALNCDDDTECTDDTCDPIDGCVNTDNTARCDDNDDCTQDKCDPETGDCSNTPVGNCEFVCRTPGFWGTHADEDPAKNCSQDITAAVIELAGGQLSVCGECISNSNAGETLAPGNAASALEALCVKVQGQQTRQLARQLLSAALNCVMSNAGNTCAGANTIDWATCNAVCAGTSTAMTVGQCIDSLDAFNNGVGSGCHDRELPLDTLFPNGTRCTSPGGNPKLGPAGSSDECHSARSNNCTTIQPNENNCTSDSCP